MSPLTPVGDDYLLTWRSVLEFIAAVFALLTFTGSGRDKQTHAVPAKNHRVSEESV